MDKTAEELKRLTLDELAEAARASHGKWAQCETEARRHRIEAALAVAEGRRRFDAEGDTRRWLAWAKKELKLERTQLYSLLKIGQAEDPVKECERQATMGAERQAELRMREDRKKHPGIFDEQPEHDPQPGNGAAPERKMDDEQRDRQRLERFAREGDIGLVREALAIFDSRRTEVRRVAAGDLPRPRRPDRHVGSRPSGKADGAAPGNTSQEKSVEPWD